MSAIDPNANRPGYRRTEVGWIPEEWDCLSLGVICRKISSGISRPFFDDPDGSVVAALRSGNVSEGRILEDDVKFWHDPDPRGSDLDKVRPAEGDILVNFVNGSRKELGKAAVFRGRPKNCIVSTNFFIVRLNPKKADANYLGYHFHSTVYRRWLNAVVGFSGPGSFNQEQIGSHRVPLPSLPEQTKIAEILSTCDEAIEKTGALIEAKKRQKRALMQHLLTGRKRLPGFAGEWEEARLGDLFSERTEINREDLPLLAITGTRGIIPSSEIDRKDSSSADKRRYKVIQPGDIGYNTMRMWQGVSAVSALTGIVSPAYTICVPNDSVDVRFMGHFFKFPPMVHLFWRYSQGLVDDTLNLKFPNFSVIHVKVPGDRAEQTAIADVLQGADEEIAALESRKSVLEKQKRSLMQKLLTGQVRVKV